MATLVEQDVIQVMYTVQSTAPHDVVRVQMAEGEADLYPRLGRTMEWDIAAGHAVNTNVNSSTRGISCSVC